MNERIAELYNEALNHHGLDLTQDILQKFAELIIKDSIKALEKEIDMALDEFGEQLHIDVILLEHFDIS